MMNRKRFLSQNSELAELFERQCVASSYRLGTWLVVGCDYESPHCCASGSGLWKKDQIERIGLYHVSTEFQTVTTALLNNLHIAL